MQAGLPEGSAEKLALLVDMLAVDPDAPTSVTDDAAFASVRVAP